MMTRAEMMAFKTSEEMSINHRRYYGEIADEIGAGRNLPEKLIEAAKVALAHGNVHLNQCHAHPLRGYPLQWWDMMSNRLPGAAAALKKRGDCLSISAGVCILKEAARRKTERAIMESYGLKIATRAEFHADAEKPDGLLARAEEFMKTSSHVVYDPAGGENGFMVWGNYPHELVTECCEHGLFEHITETDAQARAAIDS